MFLILVSLRSVKRPDKRQKRRRRRTRRRLKPLLPSKQRRKTSQRRLEQDLVTTKNWIHPSTLIIERAIFRT